jgi:hypothetical protein
VWVRSTLRTRSEHPGAPAAGLSAGEILAVLKEHATHATGADNHLPAVLAVSRDGWVHGSSLADVPASNDAEKFRLCLKGAATIRPVFLCLLDATEGGPSEEPLIAYASREGSGVVEPKAGVDPEIMALIAPGLVGADRDENRLAGTEISVARARGFAKAAESLVR